ncbi:MAG: hypothetical protein P4L40_15680 [Terracidiphilus sp.]|nr:hypothetical protein [Terracidiphilus sp.]
MRASSASRNAHHSRVGQLAGQGAGQQPYNESMARGWESKSVEEQMANAAQALTPASGSSFSTEEQKRLAFQQQAKRARRRQQLNLERENILSQRTSHPARREALEAALKQVEAQLEALG